MAYEPNEGNSRVVALKYFQIWVSQVLDSFYDKYTNCLFSHEIARRYLVILQDNFL